ncbi:MAG: hypothetical protein ACRCTZ_10775 [Sarcina sp.]
MLEIKKNSLLDSIEYEDYDVNVVKLTREEQIELDLIKKSCCGSTNGCSKERSKGNCCENKGGCCS